jgi:hypothetical protein
MNVVSWNSLKAEFDQKDTDLRGGHIWAAQEHKLPDENACAQAQELFKQHGWKGYFTLAG